MTCRPLGCGRQGVLPLQDEVGGVQFNAARKLEPHLRCQVCIVADLNYRDVIHSVIEPPHTTVLVL